MGDWFEALMLGRVFLSKKQKSCVVVPHCVVGLVYEWNVGTMAELTADPVWSGSGESSGAVM